MKFTRILDKQKKLGVHIKISLAVRKLAAQKHDKWPQFRHLTLKSD